MYQSLLFQPAALGINHNINVSIGHSIFVIGCIIILVGSKNVHKSHFDIMRLHCSSLRSTHLVTSLHYGL